MYRTNRRESIVVQVLSEMGYGRRLIKRHYPVWSTDGVVHHEIVAFGKVAPQDMTTATILARIGEAESAIDEALGAARALACPAALVALEDELQLWSVSGSNAHQRVFQGDYSQVSELTSRFGRALTPAGLLGAKTLGRQLTLFPVDVQLLASARAGMSSQLSVIVLQAMDLVLQSLPGWAARSADHSAAIVPEPAGSRASTNLIEDERLLNRASEIVLGTMAALVIRDKLSIPAVSPADLLAQASERFPGYFRDGLYEGLSPEVFSTLFDMLGDSISYAGIDSAVVSDVYENAVVSEAERFKLGIYYTPSWLADAIARMLPFEAIAPGELTVLDPACGSGTFLLAAYNRMNGLMPAQWESTKRHQFARTHLVGYDSDRFAVEIARLALLLHAMPAGNSWAVQQRDVLVGGIPQDVRPGLILSNPPWKNTRSIAGHRHELADEFLRAALGSVRPGGFIGIILPAAWLAGATSRRSRRDLIERTRVFEVWRLPESTFGRSAFAPCVVFAQARASLSRRPYVFRRVLNRAESLARFRYEGVADESYLTEASLVGDSELLRGPLSEYRPEKPMRRLDDVAQVKAGPVPRPPVAERGKTGGNDLWLRNAGAILPFQEIPESAVTHIHYPQEFHRAAAVDPSMRLPKLFVSAKRSAENPWRLKIGLDLRGVIPRETLQIVIPKSGEVDDLYGLLAVLSTAFAACWIDQAAPKMVIEPRILGSVPLPSQDDWWRFPMLGRQLVEAATSGDGTLIDVLATIENAAAASYGLSQEEVDAVRRHMAGFIAPEGVPRFEWPAESLWNVSGSRSSASAGDRRTVGAVLQAGGSRLKLWLAGVTSEEGEWVQLPSQMPGWLCEPGRTLEAFLTDGDLSAARFAYQVGSYVDDPKDLFAVASSDVAWEQL